MDIPYLAALSPAGHPVSVYPVSFFRSLGAVLNNSAKTDMHRGISVMIGKMSKIDICQHHGLELRNTASLGLFHSPQMDVF